MEKSSKCRIDVKLVRKDSSFLGVRSKSCVWIKNNKILRFQLGVLSTIVNSVACITLSFIPEEEIYSTGYFVSCIKSLSCFYSCCRGWGHPLLIVFFVVDNMVA